VTALLLENMKNASQIADKQSQEIKELSAKLSAIQTTVAINQIPQKATHLQWQRRRKKCILDK
jgi:hypothetical protein